MQASNHRSRTLRSPRVNTGIWFQLHCYTTTGNIFCYSGQICEEKMPGHKLLTFCSSLVSATWLGFCSEIGLDDPQSTHIPVEDEEETIEQETKEGNINHHAELPPWSGKSTRENGRTGNLSTSYAEAASPVLPTAARGLSSPGKTQAVSQPVNTTPACHLTHRSRHSRRRRVGLRLPNSKFKRFPQQQVDCPTADTSPRCQTRDRPRPASPAVPGGGGSAGPRAGREACGHPSFSPCSGRAVCTACTKPKAFCMRMFLSPGSL
nr:uncharacterized protein LOC109729226 [Microcebus murinus]